MQIGKKRMLQEISNDLLHPHSSSSFVSGDPESEPKPSKIQATASLGLNEYFKSAPFTSLLEKEAIPLKLIPGKENMAGDDGKKKVTLMPSGGIKAKAPSHLQEDPLRDLGPVNKE